MRWRPRRYAQGLSQDSTIEGQPRTASVGGEIVSHVDEFFGRIPCRRPSADQHWIVSHKDHQPREHADQALNA